MRLFALGARSTPTPDTAVHATPLYTLQPWVTQHLAWSDQTLLFSALHEFQVLDKQYPFSRMLYSTLFTTKTFPLRVRLTASRKEAIQMAFYTADQLPAHRLERIQQALHLLCTRCPRADYRIHWQYVQQALQDGLNHRYGASEETPALYAV